MKVSSGGHDGLMIFVASGIVFLVASGLVGGPDRLLRIVSDFTANLLGSTWNWLRWTFF